MTRNRGSGPSTPFPSESANPALYDGADPAGELVGFMGMPIGVVIIGVYALVE
ncbi:hypothetical protein [Streptomyces sp. WAC 04229]|uniref:hypothetical protein n=1 Tax=Streptomyces sp. WAC 04229 TaxID=2203206 RepID=UPI0021ADB73B|nr:hypothetical protein [Streptomyces sp. WAC 04229]